MIEVSIVCDGCLQIMGGGRTAKDVRRVLARDWSGARVGLPGGRDLCDGCAAHLTEPDPT